MQNTHLIVQAAPTVMHERKPMEYKTNQFISAINLKLCNQMMWK